MNRDEKQLRVISWEEMRRVSVAYRDDARVVLEKRKSCGPAGGWSANDPVAESAAARDPHLGPRVSTPLLQALSEVFCFL